jgi:DNA-binding NarL/FixJ family response regulator
LATNDRDGRRRAVLLAEYPLWLDALARVVRDTGVDVVGAATDAEQALALAKQHEPDLLVVEIDMPSGHVDGVSFVRRALELVPALSVVALSARRDAKFVGAALAAGVVAYVLKTAQAADIASAVRQAFDHSLYVTGGLLVRARQNAGKEGAPNVYDLTPREREILRLVALGRSNAEVARSVWLTEQTVKVHLSKTYRKLGVSNRTEASRWAQVNGLMDDSGSDLS